MTRSQFFAVFAATLIGLEAHGVEATRRRINDPFVGSNRASTSLAAEPTAALDTKLLEQLLKQRLSQASAEAIRAGLERASRDRNISRPIADLISSSRALAGSGLVEARQQELLGALFRAGLSFALAQAVEDGNVASGGCPRGRATIDAVYEALAESTSLASLGFRRSQGTVENGCGDLQGRITLLADALVSIGLDPEEWKELSVAMNAVEECGNKGDWSWDPRVPSALSRTTNARTIVKAIAGNPAQRDVGELRFLAEAFLETAVLRPNADSAAKNCWVATDSFARVFSRTLANVGNDRLTWGAVEGAFPLVIEGMLGKPAPNLAFANFDGWPTTRLSELWSTAKGLEVSAREVLPVLASSAPEAGTVPTTPVSTAPVPQPTPTPSFSQKDWKALAAFASATSDVWVCGGSGCSGLEPLRAATDEFGALPAGKRWSETSNGAVPAYQASPLRRGPNPSWLDRRTAGSLRADAARMIFGEYCRRTGGICVPGRLLMSDGRDCKSKDVDCRAATIESRSVFLLYTEITGIGTPESVETSHLDDIRAYVEKDADLGLDLVFREHRIEVSEAGANATVDPMTGKVSDKKAILPRSRATETTGKAVSKALLEFEQSGIPGCADAKTLGCAAFVHKRSTARREYALAVLELRLSAATIAKTFPGADSLDLTDVDRIVSGLQWTSEPSARALRRVAFRLASRERLSRKDIEDLAGFIVDYLEPATIGMFPTVASPVRHSSTSARGTRSAWTVPLNERDALSDTNVLAAVFVRGALEELAIAVIEDSSAPSGIRIDVPATSSAAMARFLARRRAGAYIRATVGTGYVGGYNAFPRGLPFECDVKGVGGLDPCFRKARIGTRADGYDPSFYEELGLGYRWRFHEFLFGPHFVASGVLFKTVNKGVTEDSKFIGGGASLNVRGLVDVSLNYGFFEAAKSTGVNAESRAANQQKLGGRGFMIGLQIPIGDYMAALNSGDGSSEDAK